MFLTLHSLPFNFQTFDFQTFDFPLSTFNSSLFTFNSLEFNSLESLLTTRMHATFPLRFHCRTHIGNP